MARERDYQLGVVISPDVGEDQARTLIERISAIVANNDGQVMRVIAWGRRRLAYPIEHHRDGLYYWFDMQLPPTAVAEVERQLQVNEDIIRHLLTLRDSKIVAQEREHAQQAAQEAEARAAQQAAEARAGAVPVGEADEREAAAAMGERLGVETGDETGAEVAEAEHIEPADTVHEAADEAEGSAEG
jgi:small subunit ribosomal protein S6